MITDIDASRMTSPLGVRITPFGSVRWQGGRSGTGCLLLALVPAARRCRYPIPANGARNGMVDAVSRRGAASSIKPGFDGYRHEVRVVPGSLGEKRRAHGTAEESGSGSGRCGTGPRGGHGACASSCGRHIDLGLQGSERSGARASRVSRRSGPGLEEASRPSRSRSAGGRGGTGASSELIQEGAGDEQPGLVR